MIAYLLGTIHQKTDNSLILLVQGVGYEVFCGSLLLSKCVCGETRELFIYMRVKENAMDLYGFETRRNKEIFTLLLSVSGIGPKSALSILNHADANILSNAIAKQDVVALTLSGVGKKTAEKLVQALKGKLASVATDDDSSNTGEFISALRSLGYNQSQIMEVLSKLPASAKKTEDKIKEALRMITG